MMLYDFQEKFHHLSSDFLRGKPERWTTQERMSKVNASGCVFGGPLSTHGRVGLFLS